MKYVLHALALAAVVSALWFFSRFGAPHSPASAPAAPPVDVLAALPAAPDSATGRQRVAAVEKARKTPGDAAAWLAIGDALAQEFRDRQDESLFAHAEAAYIRSLDLHPRSIAAHCGLAWVYGARHEFPVSLLWAEKALTLDPQSPAALGIIGDAQVELGDYDSAAASYQKMMDARPDLSSWSRGAHLLWLTGDKAKALWLMDKAIRAGGPHPENTAWCRAQSAMMHFHDGALLPAQQVIQPALDAGSRHAPVLLAAGRIAAARGEGEAAIAHYRRLLEAGPQHDALVALGDLHLSRGEREEAEKCYVAVAKLHTTHLAMHSQASAHSHLAMAKFLADHGRDPAQALRLVEHEKLTGNVHAADTLAWIYFQNGDLPRAREAIKRALKYNTPDAAIHYHAGLIAAAAGDTGAAMKHLQRALSLNPQFDPLHAPLALKKLDALSTAGTTAAR
jgi:tetratricopeptide (TPR) repeat protein